MMTWRTDDKRRPARGRRWPTSRGLVYEPIPDGEPTSIAEGGRDVRVDQPADGRRAMLTIELPLGDETCEAELVADEHGTLWVAQRSAAIGVRTEHSRSLTC